MPTYEYSCRNCNEYFDMFFKTFGNVEQKPLCPKCKSENTERMMSVFASAESGGAKEFTGCGEGCGCAHN
ncbi:MAG: zinc ribbon domain-containing protein [Candidatus Marinimicrobia bacterium]|nr:zinc ribbon domain-containing protein [Candidatus Neomarinimicrobiota bacterium]MCH7955671.1 zinc ribbon domain-containing protein [Candidatus Neomarinimicrobiota bacterium]